jgi:hypothetical protein
MADFDNNIPCAGWRQIQHVKTQKPWTRKDDCGGLHRRSPRVSPGRPQAAGLGYGRITLL